MTTNASRPAVQAMMADIVRPEDRVRAFSLNYWAINLGFAFSATAAGLIAEYSYLARLPGEAGMTLLCAVLVFVKLPESRPGGRERGAQERRDRRSGSGRCCATGGTWAWSGSPSCISLVFMQGSVGLPVAMGADGLSARGLRARRSRSTAC